MLLEAVSTCVNYSDFLAESLPLNRPLFDRYVVVTAPEDKATQQVCDAYDVEVVLTDEFRTRYGEMHKSKGINAGLHFLKRDGWVVHLDADIVLPTKTRVLLNHAELDRSMVYGADRLKVPGFQAWRTHQAMPYIQHDGYHVRLGAFEMMPRFNAWHIGGYSPCGYFQLWHPSASGVQVYPADHSEADRTDVLFGQQWPRAKRSLIPELAVYHLESEPAAQGANWGGRVTCRWGPDPWWSPDPWRHHHHHKHHCWPPEPNPRPCPPEPGPYGRRAAGLDESS
jgi:hypothetical protein